MLSLRNPHNSKAEAVRVRDFYFDDLVGPALLASGFRVYSSGGDFISLLPCPVGTFSNFSSKGTGGCTPCPPGILQLSQ